MNLFKERLIIVGGCILALILLVAVFIFVAYIPYLIPAICVIVALTAVFVIVRDIVRFINWLFIEPFRKGRAK